MPKQTVGIGIVGAGFLAETRARCYGQVSGVDARLVAVAARTAENAEGYARRHGIAQAFTDLDRLLELDQVDMVDLCVPNLLHRPFAERAAAAGKHIVCTKPLAAYVGQDLGDSPSDEEVSAQGRRRMLEVAVDDALAMVKAARNAGVKLMYGENWIHAPSIVRAEKLLGAASGSVLEMRGWECHNGSHSPYSKLWRYTGGGALIRLAAHPIGAMIHLKRQEGLARSGKPIRPIAITAEVSDLSRTEGLDAANTKIATGWVDVENWGCAILSFSDGSRGVAYGSDTMLGGMESKLEILGSSCHLKCNLSPHDMLRAYASDTEVFGDEYLMEKVDTKAGWSTPIPDEDWSSGQLAMVQNYVNAVAHDEEVACDGELGLEVTRAVYSAYLSAETGARVEL